MAESAPIYVEIRMRAALDEVWRRTQTPQVHQRWDLRFSEIDYLPRADPTEPQRFRYTTRIGFGLRIEGFGETTGSSDKFGARASALRFWSEDAKSLIVEGAGYWRYEPTDDGVRFLTRYEYRARFGAFGALLDRLLFRPLLGWATAWSFDRLRLWIERDIPPELSLQRSLVHATARLALAFVWIYQGLVPKLLFAESSGELATVRALGAFEGYEGRALTVVALGEIAVGAWTLLAWRARSILVLQGVALALLGAAAALGDPGLFSQQFNPATLSVAMIALAACAWWCGADLPTASNCRRAAAGDER